MATIYKAHGDNGAGIELQPLTIITGPNGSGKTRLLQSMARGSTLWDSEIPTQHDLYGMPAPSRHKTNRVLWTSVELSALSVDATTVEGRQANIARLRDLLPKVIEDELRRSQNPRIQLPDGFGPDKLELTAIAARAKKEVLDLIPSDVENYHVPRGSVLSVSENFFALAKRYSDLISTNLLYRASRNSEKLTQALEDDEFVAKWGPPPWDELNTAMASAGLPYIFVLKDDQPWSIATTLKFEFLNVRSNRVTQLTELSSGEKVMFGLLMASLWPISTTGRPEVLLLDEPDSLLHPTLIRYFLKFIQDLFVNKMGMLVCIVTHSPATVALAPSNCIYAMQWRESDYALAHVVQDVAIRSLSEGVPTLSTRIANRRVVFTESHHDAAFYDEIYGILAPESEFSLTFIPSGNPSAQGNKDAVKLLTSHLVSAGVPGVRGVIDWDGTETSSDVVIVNAEQEYYSLENVVLDPLAIAILLRQGPASAGQLTLGKYEYPADFQSFTNEKLQGIANVILSRIQPHVTVQQRAGAITRRYRNGKQIEIPNWFSLSNGHVLEKIIDDEFIELRRVNVEGSDRRIMSKVIYHVFGPYSGFIPTTFACLFGRLLK